MIKNGVNKAGAQAKGVQKILITQPRPDSEKSPYFELGRKYSVELDFHPFIRLEGIPARDFRKQKIEIQNYTGVIFTSRNAIDHFFRMCEEIKVNVSQDTKYFCITESVALYLQKFILYRKRKVFYGADGTNKSMFDVINKHKENERFLYPCSENQQDNEIVGWLKANNCGFATPFMYRTISNDVKEIMGKNFDIICFFQLFLSPFHIVKYADHFYDHFTPGRLYQLHPLLSTSSPEIIKFGNQPQVLVLGFL